MKKCIKCTGIKSVFVRDYKRTRNGKIENVTQHCRSLPNSIQYRLWE